MPSTVQTGAKLTECNRTRLEDYLQAGLISKRAYDKLYDKRIEEIALERIKTTDKSKFLTQEELKARLGIKQ